MRIIILGGTGMLGHILWERLSSTFQDTFTTIRRGRTDYGWEDLYKDERVIEYVDMQDEKLLEGVLRAIQPMVILNCIGITKRREEPGNPIPSITLNALFPHRLGRLADDLGAKVIHFSTDCVFDGAVGHYCDDYLPNATDLYGRTKALGELSSDSALTLRSSFIGRELRHGTELLEWFLAQRGTVKGFMNAIYTGLTTEEMGRVVEKLLREYPEATGLYNVSSEPISKYELLKLIGQKMNLDTEVLPEETFYCDRSLDSSRFRKDFSYTPPTWERMIEELALT